MCGISTTVLTILTWCDCGFIAARQYMQASYAPIACLGWVLDWPSRGFFFFSLVSLDWPFAYCVLLEKEFVIMLSDVKRT